MSAEFVEFALVTVPTGALAHVTYLNTYKDSLPDEWPHNKAARHIKRVVVHSGRYVLWQVANLPGIRRRAITRTEDDAA
jgi:hypothetical protein